MRILIVDDSEDIRDFIEALLIDAGYKDIKTAASAAEAFDALTLMTPSTQVSATPDLVLLDVGMPEVDGIEVCARIRNDLRYTDLPIIMVTQLSDLDTLANAFIAGATDYIVKPVVRIELLARVRSALKLKAELDRRRDRERELLKRVSSPGDDRSYLIDDVTGLFVGEVAEAYLHSAVNFTDKDTSVIALVVDRINAYRSTQGDAAAEHIMAQVARSIRGTAATVGVVGAAYRNGIIVLIAPETGAEPAKALGERLRASISGLAIANTEAIVADHVTASVATITGRVDHWADLTHLLSRAISVVREVSALGGDRLAIAYA